MDANEDRTQSFFHKILLFRFPGNLKPLRMWALSTENLAIIDINIHFSTKLGQYWEAGVKTEAHFYANDYEMNLMNFLAYATRWLTMAQSI